MFNSARSRDHRRRLTVDRSKTYNIASLRSSSCFAICHACCWTISVVLGISSIWLRRQFNNVPQGSFFGLIGVSSWASLPYAVTSILCVASAKRKSPTTVKWLFSMSVLSIASSICIFAYSCMSIVIDATLGTSVKLVTVAAVLCAISLIETVSALLCCISCCSAIGRGGRVGINLSQEEYARARVLNANEDAGHVTVMALPARQAAELFYTMYRPMFGTRVAGDSDETVGMRGRTFAAVPDYADNPGYLHGLSPYMDAEMSDDDRDIMGSLRPRRLATPNRRPVEDITEEAELRPGKDTNEIETPGQKADSADETRVQVMEESQSNKQSKAKSTK